ncbi:phospholipase [Acidisoma cellulosilytica]|uniref:Phospholipase n=1 Tax=Acidisoma cellulosilyticum TaxID=2802395 RepID=A0A964E6L5_9PROT|nr:alkaline phosphatase family protein [Acidisoma cellulosilyticum]MCB8883890.1 phospholipase [Acidisoma cellulosilyticum]
MNAEQRPDRPMPSDNNDTQSVRPIEHVVVLMLENRSFDSMLGRLYPDRPDFDGLTGQEANPWHRQDGRVMVPVWNDAGLSRATAAGPDPDPGELFHDMEAQFFGAAGMTPDGQGLGIPSMNGFVDSYMRQPRGLDDSVPDPAAIMHCFSPTQVPVLSELARSFGVSDRWFASAPCQTWPNRFFVHTGTAGGWVNNDPPHFPYRMPSLFRRLTEHRKDWAVYFHDLPNTALLTDIWSRLPTPDFRLYEHEFAEDARNGILPAYTFIEPRYLVSRFRAKVPNDQHPPTNIIHAEQLIAETYNALRQSPQWTKTLFIIIYDEHGGTYDHVAPPPATPPGGPYPDGFTFNRYGARVPAVLISPHIPAGSVIRPADPEGAPFDHTSVIRTVQELFGLGSPLTDRVAAAPSLLPALANDTPLNMGPERIAFVPSQPTPEEISRLRKTDNVAGLQFSMSGFAATLLGTIARISAHFRHGVRRSGHRAGVFPARRRKADRKGWPL